MSAIGTTSVKRRASTSRNGRQATRNRLKKRRLILERLEDRIVLAQVLWDGGGDGVSGLDTYSGGGDLSFPVPLEAGVPWGSLIYDSSVQGTIQAVDDSNGYAVDLNSGQAVTVVLATHGGLQGKLELLDPNGVSLGTAAAATPNNDVVLQTVQAMAEGTYQVVISGLHASIGGYTARLILNAAVEMEEHSGVSNDNLGSAQDIDGSFLTVVGAGQRGAVLGNLAVDGSDVDWYSFSLSANEMVTLAVTGLGQGNLTLDFYNSGGQRVASGIAGHASGQFDQLITGYQASAGDTYYAAVNGVGRYSLLVTRGMEIDTEPNTSPGDAQWLTPARCVVGSLGRSEKNSEREIRVALLKTWSMSADQQLADDTYFDFEPVLVSASQIDTIEKLSAFDVVVIGDDFSRTQLSAIGPALRSWVEAGGGVVAVAPLISEIWTGLPLTDIDAIVPVKTSEQATWQMPPFTVSVTDQNHPVTDGVDSFPVASSLLERPSIDPNARQLGVVDGHPAIVVSQPGRGRGVYLALTYAYSGGFSSELRFGMADRLFEQAVAWAAGGITDTADQYLMEVNTGDALVITTSTPGRGPYHPSNDLDPMLALYDSAGTLVASNDNWLVEDGGDGRNARILHTVGDGTGGTYRVRVAPEAGSGDYALLVEGASGVRHVPLTVTAASIPDGATLITWPDLIQLEFNSPLLMTSVQASDLTVNGTPAADLTVVDGKTLQFDLAGTYTGDGVYQVDLAANVMQNLFASYNEAFSLEFTIDTDAPVVTASSIVAGEVIAPGDVSYSVTFSKELDTSTLGPEDVTLIENSFGTTFAPTSFEYDPASNRLSIGFSALYDGDYTLTLISGPEAFRDLSGKELNGAPSRA